MQCPHCFAEIRRKERHGKKCPRCYKIFAFEPKEHPLMISDKAFNNAVSKLGAGGNLRFTKQQLMHALSRKKIASRSVVWVYVLAILTTLIAAMALQSILVGILLAAFWVAVIIFAHKHLKSRVRLPQTIDEFEASVTERWREVYGGLPPNIVDSRVNFKREIPNARAVLVCEGYDAAEFLTANDADVKLNSIILAAEHFSGSLKNELAKTLAEKRNIPVFCLHDASAAGYEFFRELDNFLFSQSGGKRRARDIGLRPQTAMRSKMLKLRERTGSSITGEQFPNLTEEEINWLREGFYTPLSAVRPAKLLENITKRIEKRGVAAAQTADPEKIAESVGFMTWAK